MPTVLVIDDDRSLRIAITKILRKADYRVLAAASGDEGIAHLANEPIDVVLTDLKMEGMDGLAVLRAVREAAPLAQVVLITAHGTSCSSRSSALSSSPPSCAPSSAASSKSRIVPSAPAWASSSRPRPS